MAKRFGDGTVSESELKMIESTPMMDVIHKVAEEMEKLGEQFEPDIMDESSSSQPSRLGVPARS
jgi:hypothetical protein